jgi:ABC-2 type transport system permease protein
MSKFTKMLRAVGLIFSNEFRLVATDRVGIFMLVLAPVMIILVAGLSLGNVYGVDPEHGAYVVPIIDEDHGRLAHSIIAALDHEPALALLRVDNLAEARTAVARRDRTPLAIIIPAGTTRALETGREAHLILYVDPIKRFEVGAIELRLDQLCREVTARAQDQARRRIVDQVSATQRLFGQIGAQIKQVQAAATRYRHQLTEQRERAEASLNSQVQRTIDELQEQTQRAIARSTAEASSALARAASPRRDALLAVSRYLIALQASDRDFDRWFAALKAKAGSHSAEIPPPPPLPIPPSKEQLAELSKPIVIPQFASPDVPALSPLTIRLPDLPPPPHFELPAALGLPPPGPSMLPGYLDWRERPVSDGSPRSSAFDEYVPGFGVTFLLIAMLMGVGMGLIDERDWGTLQRLRVSGAPLAAVLIGKLSSRFVVGVLQMTVLFAVGWGLFGISLGRAPAMLLVPTAAISFAAAAFSLVIACLARTHDSVMPVGVVAAMTMSAIGGCWWPRDFEPGWLRMFSQLLPTTWTMQAYNDLMIRHTAAATAVWPSAVTASLGLLYLIVGMIAASKVYEWA